MRSAQNIDRKEQNTTPNQHNNMKGSRSQQGRAQKELDFDYYLSKKFGHKTEPERNLYFEKLLEAFRTLSEEAPEVFDSIAPEMLQRSIWSWRGTDPLLSKKFNNWITMEYKWTPFDDILPKDETFANHHELAPLNPDQLNEVHHSLLENLQDRFRGNPHRWDASRRDQFIILGMLASAGGYGVRQGKLIHSLGMEHAENSVRGSNTIRAAKIALTRLAKPLGLQLFAPAAGHGSERIHAFEDPELAEIIARYVLNHEASILLPATNVPAFMH
jgi:hypothetical protein